MRLRPESTGSLIQQAYDWAEQTPWALAARAEREPHAVDPRLRLLIAEVQVRCGSPFVEPDATSHEEKLARRTPGSGGRCASSERSSSRGTVSLRPWPARNRPRVRRPGPSVPGFAGVVSRA